MGNFFIEIYFAVYFTVPAPLLHSIFTNGL